MFRTTLSVLAVFALMSTALAQPPTPEERVRTSTVVPDFHNANGEWSKEYRRDANLVSVSYKGKDFFVRGSEEYYVNTKDKMMAYLWIKMDSNGNKEEFAMLYGTDNVARGAIKSQGKWFVSRDLYFDNGKGNPSGSVSPAVVYDDKEVDKPIQVKFILETVAGLKEVVFDLQ